MPSSKPAADFTYTDAEMLALWREALAVVAVRGKSYTLGGGNGRTLTSFDLPEIREMIDFFEKRVQSASGLSVNLARMQS